MRERFEDIVKTSFTARQFRMSIWNTVFLTGRESRIYLFNDWGFYNFKTADGVEEDILPGYGIGVRFMTPLGIMSVDYGLGRKDTFSTGKIHIGIVNSF